MVTQESFLFNGTIRENLLMGKPDATDAELLIAAEAANARPFIDRLTEGLSSVVGERGVKLSVGEKQRLSIARALLERSADSCSRRSDGQRRHRDRTIDPGGAGTSDVSSHLDRDRASAFDRRARRSNSGA